MSVIENAKLKYNYYLSKIIANLNKSDRDSIKQDLYIYLVTIEDNLTFSFAFNIIYWGSPYLKNKSSREKMSYVLKIIKSAQALSFPDSLIKYDPNFIIEEKKDSEEK